MQTPFISHLEMGNRIYDLGKARTKQNSVFGIAPTFLGPEQSRIILVVIVTDKRSNPAFERLVNDVLEFIEKFDLSIYLPAFKILVGAPYVDGVKHIDSEAPE